MADSSPKPSTSNSNPVVPVNPKKRKRRRTRSHNSSPSPGRGFFVPGFENPGSNSHKMMSLHEIMDAARGKQKILIFDDVESRASETKNFVVAAYPESSINA